MRGSHAAPWPAVFRALSALCAATLVGCAHLPRPDGPDGPSARDAAYLDGDDSPRLLIEIDRVEGTSPRPRSIGTLLKKIRLYLDKPGGVEVVLDDLIPRTEWQEEASAIHKLARRYRSVEAPDDAVVLHLLYGPGYKKYRGFAWGRRSMQRGDKNYNAALVVVLQDRLKPIVWITGVKQESSVLVHELGHVLGLATNPGHSTKAHCTNAHCLMYDGVDARTFWLYFFPTLFTGYLPLDFCGDCQDDLYERWSGVPPGRR